jgi:hypothetical protein
MTDALTDVAAFPFIMCTLVRATVREMIVSPTPEATPLISSATIPVLQ